MARVARDTRNARSISLALHHATFEVNVGKGSGKTRTDTLMPQPETGKISYVHHLPYARLPPDALLFNFPTNCGFRPRAQSGLSRLGDSGAGLAAGTCKYRFDGQQHSHFDVVLT